MPGIAAKLVNALGDEASDGEIGEVLVRGPNVCSGYWRQPEATAEALLDRPDGRWLRTRDLGERSTDGYYTLRGRASDLIISGGFNIYPREIEELLLEQQGVLEAAVCGVPDARRGEVPVAYIVVDDKVDAKELAAALEEACRKSLASFKVPRAFLRVESLPRNALGKVQKHALPQWKGM